VTVQEPEPPLFPAGYGPLPSDMDSWIQQPFQFLTTKVMFRAELQASQALTANANTLIHFGSTAGDILEDPYGGWSTTATSAQPAWSWLCPAGCTGLYEVTMTAFTANPSGGATAAVIFLDGTEYGYLAYNWGGDGQASGACGGGPFYLTGGIDYIQGYIGTVAAVNTTATAGQYPTLEIAWVST